MLVPFSPANFINYYFILFNKLLFIMVSHAHVSVLLYIMYNAYHQFETIF